MTRSHTAPLYFFFFNDTATTEIYTLSLHDALPILHGIADGSRRQRLSGFWRRRLRQCHHAGRMGAGQQPIRPARSEEHTSELQSRQYLVCRLLLDKKNEAQVENRLCVRRTTRGGGA